MSKDDKYKKIKVVLSSQKLRRSAKKYIKAIEDVLEGCISSSDPANGPIEVLSMGYAMGVVAATLSDLGTEGYTLLLDGMAASMHVEERKEKLMYAVLDKNGILHTSDECFTIVKGGEK